MLDIKKLLTKLVANSIITNSANNYITIGKFAVCWGRKTPPSINTSVSVTFPITFASAPHGFATFHAASAKGNTHNQITTYNESTTGMTVYYYEASGSIREFNWLAIGFIS